MTRNRLIYFSIALFGILFTIILLQQNNVAAMQRRLQWAENKTAADSLAMQSLKYLVLTHGKCINIKLEKDFLLSNSNYQTVPLRQVLGKGRKYVYHFRETNCMSCVESFVPFLKKLAGKVGKDNIIMLGSYQNAKHLFLTLEKYELDGIAVYNLPPEYLMNEKISIVNAPCIFRIDSTLQVTDAYIPEKGLPGLSAIYTNKATL